LRVGRLAGFFLAGAFFAVGLPDLSFLSDLA